MPQIIPAVKAAAAAWAAFAAKHAVIAGIIKFTVTLAASYGIGRVLQKKLPGSSITGGSPLEVTRNPLTARRVIYGELRVGGEIRFHYSTGGNNNQYLYLIIVWCTHEAHAIDELYLNDELVPLDGSGNATGTFAGFVRCTHHLGAWDQAADANFVAELGGTIWTANDRLRGCAYSAVRLKWDQAKFPGGLPQVTAKGRWRKCYDLRDGAQNANDPATWTYTMNADVCFYDYLRGVPVKKGDGAIARLFGLNALDDEIDTPAAIAAMNVSDEDVALAEVVSAGAFVVGSRYKIATVGTTNFTAIGAASNTVGLVFTATGAGSGSGTANATERRYRVGGAIDLDAPPSTIIEHFRSATAGTLQDIGGQLVIRAGAWLAPDTDLGENILRGGISCTAPLSWREKVNYVRGSFTNPAAKYARTDFPPVKSDALITADGGELQADLDLSGFVVSHTQAQRIAKIKMLRTRQGIVFTAPCNLRAAVALAGENFTWDYARFGWADKAFELLKFTLSIEKDKNNQPGFAIGLTAQETDASIYDWATNEEDALDPAPNTTLPDPRNVAAPTNVLLTSGAATVQIQKDGTAVPRLKVAWTAAVDQAVQSGGIYRWRYKTVAAPEWSEGGTVKGDQVFIFILDVLIGTAYQVEVRAENNLGVPSAWVAPAAGSHIVVGDTTAPGDPSGLSVTARAGYNEIKWNASAADDISEYNILRNTVADAATATKIGENDGTFWNDSTAVPGTQYWYYIQPVDGSENGGNRVLAGNVITLDAPLGNTQPSDPTAATKTAEGTYLGNDGTALAFLEFSVPVLPAGAQWQEVVFRRNVSGEFMPASRQFKNTGGAVTARIDDLTPGVVYQVGTIAKSPGKESNLVLATGSPFTAPNPSGAPTTPSGGAFSLSGLPPVFIPGTPIRTYASRVSWTDQRDSNFAYWEVKVTTSNDPNGSVSGFWLPFDGSLKRLESTVVFFDSVATLSAAFVHVRQVNRSGGPSAWHSIGQMNSIGNAIQAGGDLSEQSKASVDVDGGDITGVTARSHSLKVGDAGASSPLAHKVIYAATDVKNLTGGADTEVISLDLSNRGFTTKPDWGFVQCANHNDIIGHYDFDHGSNSSTTAHFVLSMKTAGANLPSGNHRFSFIVGKYS